MHKGEQEPMSDLFWDEETKTLLVWANGALEVPQELRGVVVCTVKLFVILKLAREIFGGRILSQQEARALGIPI